jgi:hypothetical protein
MQLNEMFRSKAKQCSGLWTAFRTRSSEELPRQVNEMHHPDIVRQSPYAWVGEFIEKFGRPPRVLHIGNVANNAYSNAKFFRRAGIDADVLCNDFYHIMGCPEWEDADFEAEFINQFFPDWSRG